MSSKLFHSQVMVSLKTEMLLVMNLEPFFQQYLLSCYKSMLINVLMILSLVRDTGRNPKTGEQARVKPKKLPFFKVGKELQERVDYQG